MFRTTFLRLHISSQRRGDRGFLSRDHKVGLNPSRVGFLSVVKASGLTINFEVQREQCNEPVGFVRVEGSRAPKEFKDSPLTIDGDHVAGLIDELPLLAVIGSQLDGGIEIRNASELRVKESDRIAATVAGLRGMGADVEEFDDGLRAGGRTRLHGARIDSRGDHRIAMSFAVAGLLAEGDTETNMLRASASLSRIFKLIESVVEDEFSAVLLERGRPDRQ